MTPVTTGNILSIDIDMDNPKIKLGPIQFNHLSVFTGTNGTGKSFILKCSWFMSMLAQNVIAARKTGVTLDLIKTARYIWDRTFEEHDKMTGKVSATFENGGSVDVEFNTGILMKHDVNIPAHITEPSRVNFMSRNMRTFDAMHMYLKLRSTVNSTNVEVIIDEMCKNFKLYDVIAVESLIAKMPLTVDSSLQARIHNFDDKLHITAFNVDLAKCQFYSVDDKGAEKNMALYSAGHQSLLNMLITNS